MRFSKLQSPYFAIALLLLALNDALLKQAVPGYFTGKLSDAAGIFAFCFFLFALLPCSPLLIIAGVSLLFAYWKSPLSDSLLAALNTNLNLPLSRIPDCTDLAVLPVCAAALLAYRNASERRISRATSALLLFVPLLAFGATTMPYHLPGEGTAEFRDAAENWPRREQSLSFAAQAYLFHIGMTADEFLEKLRRLGYSAGVYNAGGAQPPGYYAWHSGLCCRFPGLVPDLEQRWRAALACPPLESFTVHLRQAQGGIDLSLSALRLCTAAGAAPLTSYEALHLFEQEIIKTNR